MVDQHDAVRVEIVHALVFAALVLGDLHDRADVIVRHDDRRFDERLLDEVDVLRRRQLCRIVHGNHFARRRMHMVNDAGRCGDQLQMILALQALLNHVHVEKPKEAAAVTEA